jgi:hypothetical protein
MHCLDLLQYRNILAAFLLSDPSIPDNILAGSLIPAGFCAQGFLAPGALGTRHTYRRTAFTTSMRMVPGRHCRSTDSGTDAQMALPACFAQFNIAMINIAHLADCCHAGLQDQADFSRRQSDLTIFSFFGFGYQLE